MRFVGAVVAWIFASLITFVAGIGAGQNVALNEIAALGAPMPIDVRFHSVIETLMGTTSYAVVVAIGFAIAFYVASLVKALLPALAIIAYPLAGGLAIAVALEIMRLNFGIYPLPGAEATLGYALHVAAGAIGGVIFEVFRPRRR